MSDESGYTSALDEAAALADVSVPSPIDEVLERVRAEDVRMRRDVLPTLPDGMAWAAELEFESPLSFGIEARTVRLKYRAEVTR